MTPLVPPFDYVTDPGEIERRSFAEIRACTDLGGFGPRTAEVAMRLVHASGDPRIVDALVAGEAAAAAGVAALTAGAPVLCDVEMVRHGLTRRFLRGEPECFLHDPDTVARAKADGITRTMAGVDAWRPQLAGAVAVIGNAPTALFRLLEMLHAGAPWPALVVGMPCGFVGAAESKAALAHLVETEGLPAILVHGRAGGSALAAACINALARMACSEAESGV